MGCFNIKKLLFFCYNALIFNYKFTVLLNIIIAIETIDKPSFIVATPNILFRAWLINFPR